MIALYILLALFVLLVLAYIALLLIKKGKKIKKSRGAKKVSSESFESEISQKSEKIESEKVFSEPFEKEEMLASLRPETIGENRPKYRPMDKKDIIDFEAIEKENAQRDKEDDFDEFLTRHSHSRFADKNKLLPLVKDLPKEVKMLLVSGIYKRPDFRKYDEDDFID